MGTVENVARRKELNNAIAVQLPLILNMANNTLERCLNYSDGYFFTSLAVRLPSGYASGLFSCKYKTNCYGLICGHLQISI